VGRVVVSETAVGREGERHPATARNARVKMARNGKNNRLFMNIVPCGKKIRVMMKSCGRGEAGHAAGLQVAGFRGPVTMVTMITGICNENQ